MLPLGSTVTRFSDPAYLLAEQYHDAANLDVRVALHERFGTSSLDWHRGVFDQIALAKGETLLEAGCGSGALWRKNAGELPERCRLVLSDLSPGMLATTRRALEGAPLTARYAVADVQALPFRTAAFDVVVANHMLYHAPDVDRALAELRRVLRPGGRLVAATNGRGHLRELRDLMAFAGAGEHFDDEERFGLETGFALLERHFARVDVKRYDDALAVTEAEPLIAYIRSMVGAGALSNVGEERVRQRVERTIAEHGAFHVAKAAGLLVASP